VQEGVDGGEVEQVLVARPRLPVDLDRAAGGIVGAGVRAVARDEQDRHLPAVGPAHDLRQVVGRAPRAGQLVVLRRRLDKAASSSR